MAMETFVRSVDEKISGFAICAAGDLSSVFISILTEESLERQLGKQPNLRRSYIAMNPAEWEYYGFEIDLFSEASSGLDEQLLTMDAISDFFISEIDRLKAKFQALSDPLTLKGMYFHDPAPNSPHELLRLNISSAVNSPEVHEAVTTDFANMQECRRRGTLGYAWRVPPD